MNKYTINDITRASGGFAMLAVDQREAMRMMFAAAGAPAPVADSVLTDFKVNAAKTLSPYASAILVDQQFCYRQVVEQNAIAKSCAMIVAADEFIPGNGIPVDSVVIDRKINPLQIKQDVVAINSIANKRSSMLPKSWATVALTSTKLKCRFTVKVRNKSFSVLHNV